MSYKSNFKKPKIAIVGLRGIPSRYGGTETFVEELTSRLNNDFEFYVMHEDSCFYEDRFNGVTRVHSPAIKSKSTTVPSFNDLINTLYLLLRHRNEIDLYYFLGPDAAICAFLAKLLRKKVVINPDGIEWKRLIIRSRFVPFYMKPIYLLVMVYMYLMEYLSCKLPEVTVADSVNVKLHLEARHGAKRVVYIAYGARSLLPYRISVNQGIEILKKYGLTSNGYYLTIARIVPENNIHMEVMAFIKAKSKKKLIIVGNFNNNNFYTKNLIKLKNMNNKIIYLDSIYEKNILSVIRNNCFAYIHAYEVGGTNPSLLEQMLLGKPVLAYDVVFNREVLQEGGIYFKDAEDLSEKIKLLENGKIDLDLKKEALRERMWQYNWEVVAKDYKKLFKNMLIYV